MRKKTFSIKNAKFFNVNSNGILSIEGQALTYDEVTQKIISESCNAVQQIEKIITFEGISTFFIETDSHFFHVHKSHTKSVNMCYEQMKELIEVNVPKNRVQSHIN